MVTTGENRGDFCGMGQLNLMYWSSQVMHFTSPNKHHLHSSYKHENTHKCECPKNIESHLINVSEKLSL